VFFSSHILADAEALCNRVAILAQGRVVGEGRLTDLLAFEVRGWELVVGDLDPTALDGLGPTLVGATKISEGRYALELSLERPPQEILATLTARGARLVSLNPIRDTLEDFFVKRVQAGRAGVAGAPARSGERGAGGPASDQ
jgi:ABC-2 type transport system ATP-binding protein